MNDSADEIIQAREAPLSHLNHETSQNRLLKLVDWRSFLMMAFVVVVAIIAFNFAPEVKLPPPTPAGLNNATPAPASGSNTEQLAPFAQTQRARAEEKAQAALAAFVEQQILLEDTMQVDVWGGEALASALELAKSGDFEFSAERFDSALVKYEEAVAALSEVIELGNRKFADLMSQTKTAVANLDPDQAEVAIHQALQIKPQDPAAIALAIRVQMLDEVITLLRTAKNHELGGRYDKALEVYQEVQNLDPLTEGLAELRAQARNAEAGNDLNRLISKGFAQLNQKQFSAAKKTFSDALALSPNNDIVKGALQQVAKDNDLAIIRARGEDAERAMAAEQWQQAIDAYQEVLDLDANIQFAKNGLQVAKAHDRVNRLLQNISREPQKLSSETLYLQAQEIVAEAHKLAFPGPNISALRDQVEGLLALYRDPVEVVLISDNATQIVMSNVGQLGFFERKTLSLRPGQYTIRGSQDGCRDILMNVEVLPGIQPLSVRCEERLGSR